jgi:hypothetical protein
MYDLPKKMEVSEIYIAMCWEEYPVKPSCERVGEKAREVLHMQGRSCGNWRKPVTF